jgi:hypothetical protein
MHRKTVKPLWSPRQCALSRTATEHADHSPRARAQRRANYTILRARVATSFATHDRGELPARGRMQWCDAAFTRKQRRASFDDMRSSGCTIGVCLAYSHTPAWHRRLAGGAEAARSVAAGSCLSSIIPRYPRRTQRSSHAAAQAYANGKRLSQNRTSTGRGNARMPLCVRVHVHATLEDAL